MLHRAAVNWQRYTCAPLVAPVCHIHWWACWVTNKPKIYGIRDILPQVSAVMEPVRALSQQSNSDYKNKALLSTLKPPPAQHFVSKARFRENLCSLSELRMSLERFITLLVHLAQQSFCAAINTAIKGSGRLAPNVHKKISVSDNVTDVLYKKWPSLNGWRLPLAFFFPVIVWMLMSFFSEFSSNLFFVYNVYNDKRWMTILKIKLKWSTYPLKKHHI